MVISREVEEMCVVKQGVHHGAAPIPEEAKWVQAKEVKDISGFTHGVGWCAPQQGACKLSLNVKEGIIQEALVETIGCSGMTHSAAMAAEVLPGLTVMEALNTDLVCDAINTAMRELFLQIVYGRSQSAFSEDGLDVYKRQGYYRSGGEHFYAIGIEAYELKTLLDEAGFEAQSEAFTQAFLNHADQLTQTSVNYPTSEVKYEQSIVAPAVSCLLQARCV